MDSISEDLRLLLDRERIRDCIARLARGEDRRNAPMISGSCWPDSTTDYGVFQGTFDAYLAWVLVASMVSGEGAGTFWAKASSRSKESGRARRRTRIYRQSGGRRS